MMYFVSVSLIPATLQEDIFVVKYCPFVNISGLGCSKLTMLVVNEAFYIQLYYK